MEALKLNTIIKKDGEINLTGVPFKEGETVKLIILFDSMNKKNKNILSLLPKHKLGSDKLNFRREDIYENGR